MEYRFFLTEIKGRGIINVNAQSVSQPSQIYPVCSIHYKRDKPYIIGFVTREEAIIMASQYVSLAGSYLSLACKQSDELEVLYLPAGEQQLVIF